MIKETSSDQIDQLENILNSFLESTYILHSFVNDFSKFYKDDLKKKTVLLKKLNNIVKIEEEQNLSEEEKIKLNEGIVKIEKIENGKKVDVTKRMKLMMEMDFRPVRDIMGKVKANTEYYPNLVREMFIVYLISTFEFYFESICMYLFKCFPDTLKTSKNISYRDVLNFKSMEHLTNHLIEMEIADLTYKSYAEKVKSIDRRFGVGFNFETMDEVQYIHEVRNLIVHKRGYIDSRFLKKFSHKVEGLEINHKLTLGDEDLKHYIETIVAEGRSIFNSVKLKAEKIK